MIINGKEIDFKIYRKSDAKRYESALKTMGKKEQEIQKMDKTSVMEVYDALENMFREFFVAATGTDVIGECDDIGEMKDMYFEFLDNVKKQKDAFLSSFSPQRIK